MSNYSRRQETQTIQNVGEELSVESEKVLDYATSNNLDEKQAMKDFVYNYTTYLRDGKDSYFLYGNTALITVVGYSSDDKIIYVNGEEMGLNGEEIASQDFASPGSDITLRIDGEDYEFVLKSGENFYFIMFEETEGEEHVIRN